MTTVLCNYPPVGHSNLGLERQQQKQQKQCQTCLRKKLNFSDLHLQFTALEDQNEWESLDHVTTRSRNQSYSVSRSLSYRQARFNYAWQDCVTTDTTT